MWQWTNHHLNNAVTYWKGDTITHIKMNFISDHAFYPVSSQEHQFLAWQTWNLLGMCVHVSEILWRFLDSAPNSQQVGNWIQQIMPQLGKLIYLTKIPRTRLTWRATTAQPESDNMANPIMQRT